MAVQSNLFHRVSAAAVFGPLFLVLFWFGGIPLLIGVCAVAARGTWEYCQMQKKRGLHPWTGIGVAASLVWCLWLNWFGDRLWLVPSVVILLVLLTLSMGSRNGQFRLADAEATFIGTCYVGLLSAFAMLVRNYSGFEPAEAGARWFAVLVLLGIWSTDIFAYFAGRFWGKRHPFPRISPGKTGAGFAGGIVGAVSVMIAGGNVLKLYSIPAGFSLGIVVGVGALWGDLVESMIKRNAGVKDASALIPGHGGVLDRFDSFLFVYPVVYLYLRMFH
ncbi:MAG: phosphatidate cytidylyltransferase [Gemmatimonadota bacterium]|nr:phosphatidate cytidylyltransferase [Gemmatimonadota bacterium]